MDKDRMDNFLISLIPFTLAQLHNSMSLFWHLENNGFTLDEVVSLYRELLSTRPRKKIEEMRKRQSAINSKVRTCSLCSAMVVLRPIRTPQGKANINGYRSLWLCVGEECLFEEYSLLTSREEQLRFFKETENG